MTWARWAGGKLVAIAAVEHLTKVYRKPGSRVEVHALRGINLSFEPGEYVAITGASGSGKSTLMNILGCLDRPTSGRYLLGDQDVSHLSDDELSEMRGRRLGFVFQNFNLIPQLTVRENLEVPLYYQGVRPADRRVRAMKLIQMVGLEDRSTHRPMELSGGQQQRVAIARSLINEPLILLADEPTGNLDTKTGEMIMNVFDELNAAGRTIIMVTHETDIAARARRVIRLSDGHVVSDEITR
jgi:putative ABC transport system ATP-binding protein